MIYICVNCYLLFVFSFKWFVGISDIPPPVFLLSPSDADRVLIGCSSGAHYDVTLTSTGEHLIYQPLELLSPSPLGEGWGEAPISCLI